MAHRHSYDLERRQELHHAIDELPVPDDHSTSDISADYSRSRIDQSYPEGFNNSMTSSIPRDSDAQHDSDQDLSQQQANQVMDWSQLHVTPSEGRFPQVSAPTMDIESEGNEFELGFEGHSGLISAVEHSESLSKEKSLDLDSVQPTDLPFSQSKPGSKRQNRLSPERLSANFWLKSISTGRRLSKQSLTASGNTSEVHGSALLSGHNVSHHADSAYKLALDHSVIQDELYKLKNAYAQVKSALKDEQSAHFHSSQSLILSNKRILTLESQLQDALSHLSLLKTTPKSLEELRGKQLQFALAELNRVKTALCDKETEIISLKHALSVKLVNESPVSRESEEIWNGEINRLKEINANLERKDMEMREEIEKSAEKIAELEEKLMDMKEMR